MAAVVGRTEINVRETTRKVTVPNSPIATLMYYFDCVCTCVEADNNSTIRRLRDYQNYSSLSGEEKKQLLGLCLVLSPDKLVGSIFFPASDDEEFNDGCNNGFFKVSAVSTKLLVAESLLIGGQQKKVQSIMKFKKSWIENNYLNPLRSIGEGNQQRPAVQPRRQPPPQTRDSSCVVL